MGDLVGEVVGLTEGFRSHCGLRQMYFPFELGFPVEVVWPFDLVK